MHRQNLSIGADWRRKRFIIGKLFEQLADEPLVYFPLALLNDSGKDVGRPTLERQRAVRPAGGRPGLQVAEQRKSLIRLVDHHLHWP